MILEIMSTQNPTIHSSRQQARFSLKSSTTSSTTKTLDTIKSSASSSLHEAPHTKTSSKHRTSMFSGFKIPTRKWTNNWITDWWGIELISWTVSAASIVAIFALLESHRGKPLPEWPLSITVNSLVSIFATVGQMTMMAPVVECISQLKWLVSNQLQPFLDSSQTSELTMKLVVRTTSETAVRLSGV